MQTDKQLELFKKLVPYLRGALWWAQNDLIKDRQPEFNQADEHIGHPLLSVNKDEVTSRHGAIPMLVGTSGRKMGSAEKSRCVLVEGMTKEDPSHKTYFGSIVMPGRYAFEDLLTGVRPTKVKAVGYDRHDFRRHDDERGSICRPKWYWDRTMIPNWYKPMVSNDERLVLDKWCAKHHI